MMAYTLNANEYYWNSIPYYRRAIGLLESRGERRQAARMRLGFIAALTMTGMHEEALQQGEQAHRQFKELDDDSGIARLYTNLGILHYRREYYARSLMCHKKANALFERLRERPAFAMSCFNLGNSLARTEDFQEAAHMYEQAKALSRKLGLRELFAQSCQNHAYLTFLCGRHHDAARSLRKLKKDFTESGSRRHAAICDLDMAEIELRRNRPERVIASAQLAADMFKQLQLDYEQAKALTFLGVALMQKGRLRRASIVFRVAKELFVNLKYVQWTAVVELCQSHLLFPSNGTGANFSTRSMAKFAAMDISKRWIVFLLAGNARPELAYVLRLNNDK